MEKEGHAISSARPSVLVFVVVVVNAWSKFSLGLRFIVLMVTLSILQPSRPLETSCVYDV